jgi:diguanylate cyclase (GGDEF)-like protein
MVRNRVLRKCLVRKFAACITTDIPQIIVSKLHTVRKYKRFLSDCWCNEPRVFWVKIKMKRNIEQGIQDELYLPFVDSLYANRGVVVFGAVVQAFVAYAIYNSTNDFSFIYLAIMFLIVGGCRLVLAKFYDMANGTNKPAISASKWELYYSIGINVGGFLIGLQTFLAIRSGDAFAEVSSMAMAMATMVTIVGKNFASARIVHLCTAFIFGPIIIGLLSRGDWRHIAFAVILVPFALLISSMARYVRDFLYQAVRGKLEIKAIANQFDVAINHMPQGLILFDNGGDALVVNGRAASMMRAKSSDLLVGRSLTTIIRHGRRQGLISPSIAGEVESRLRSMMSGEVDGKFVMQTVQGEHIEFTAKFIKSGSAVLLFEDVSVRVLAEENIHHMARFDALSGLANRVYFKELVRTNLSLVDPFSHVAFIVIDIDDFKHVNDSLGHLVGDDLLCRFADRISLLINEKSCFSRFGGDEFVGLLSGFETEEAAEFAARKALRSLSGHYEISGHSLNVTVSAGIVISKAKAFDLAQLMIKSDLALYESKSKGKGISTLFASAMDETYQRRQRLKNDLKAAIRNQKLDVVYQPIIDAQTMRISVCEALCRWDHPEFGPISPTVFIPLAEETGAISDLTRFMLEQACMDCNTWSRDVSVAVNLSAMDFRHTNIQDMVRVALAKSRLDPSRLEVEVTEGAILEDQAGASLTLSELKATGVRIALDDFGTGYSSLSYLHNLPLDKVKIDQTFVKDIVTNERSLKLVAGVTRLADELGLVVAIEGIETLEQFERLREHAHIDLAQGFLFGAALSPRGISTLIENVLPLVKPETKMARYG